MIKIDTAMILSKKSKKKSHGQYILKQPTLYSCLKRLETQGFINSYWGEQSNGGRRKYYTLTEMGREVFVQNQDEYEYSRTIIDQLISERAYDLDSIERVSSDEAEEENSFNAVDLIDADFKQAPVYDKAIEAEEHYSDSTQTLTENNPGNTDKPKTIEENSAQNIHDEIASHIESTSVDTATKDENSFITRLRLSTISLTMRKKTVIPSI